MCDSIKLRVAENNKLGGVLYMDNYTWGLLTESYVINCQEFIICINARSYTHNNRHTKKGKQTNRNKNSEHLLYVWYIFRLMVVHTHTSNMYLKEIHVNIHSIANNESIIRTNLYQVVEQIYKYITYIKFYQSKWCLFIKVYNTTVRPGSYASKRVLELL